MDRKKFRRQQVLDTLGKSLDSDNVLFGVMVIILGVGLGYLAIQLIKFLI